MTKTLTVCAIVASAATFHVSAQTILTYGDGSAVGVVNRAADFGPLAVNGTALSDYTEDLLFIGTDGDSWVGTTWPVFDPFHGADGADRAFYFPYGGSQGWTEIRTTDHKKIYALEFLYGNGWTTGDIYGQYPWGNHDATVEWQTWRGNTMVSSGVAGDMFLVEMGTVLGFFDASGFDKLLVKCVSAASGDPSLQALALDRLVVQTTPCTATSFTLQPQSVATCEFSDVSFTADAGGMGLLSYQWRKDGVEIYDDGVHLLGTYAPTLSIMSVTQADAGVYDCVVYANCGDAVSEGATLSVCVADYDCNGFVNGDDFDAFSLDFYWGNPAADIDHNSFVNGDDFDYFSDRFAAGC